MVKSSAAGVVPALSLLPEGQDQRPILRQEGEATPLLPGLAQDVEPEYPLIEDR